MGTSNNLINIDCDLDLVESTGLKNFAMEGLYSIVLKRDGPFKTRLFVFIPDKVFPIGDVIPIHSHKYVDKFKYLFGCVKDFCYIPAEYSDPLGIRFKSFKYSRLSDANVSNLVLLHDTKRLKIDNTYDSVDHIIRADHFHTIRIPPYSGCAAWIIEELMFNDLYDSRNICYTNAVLKPLDTVAMTTEDYFQVVLVLQKNGYTLGNIPLL